MTEQLITIEDLDNIVCGKYSTSAIIDGIAKYYNLKPYDIIHGGIKHSFKSSVIFLLRYFGIKYCEIDKIMPYKSQSTITQLSNNAKKTFFKEKETIDLFLFVLTELRQTNQNS